ncbi:MAG: helix-turn-helix domain-containing protein [Peptostreptococcaceae bacterium]
MELYIGEVIYKLRKEKGVTQENLAKAVGVSVAAVSKWESKNSYPDITILPSIARFFNTSIDNLLNYQIEISNEQVMEIAKECAILFEKDTVENAINKCEAYLREYPNNLFLKFRMGSLYMMSMASASSEEEAIKILHKAIELLEVSSTSEEQEISETSKFILSSLYTMDNKLDKAEEVLLSLPKINTDRDDMLISLYINQEKLDKAKETLRTLTYKRISNIVTCLDNYAVIGIQENDSLKVKAILDIKDNLIKEFDLEDIYGASSCIMRLGVYTKEKNVEKTIEYIEKMVDVLRKEYDLKNHVLFSELELFQGVHSRGYMLINAKKIITEESYDFVKEDERYIKVLEILDNIV